MGQSPDYYAILGVAPDSEDVVIRAAYRALMQKYHPDKFASDPAFANRKAREINEAYAVLNDESRRAAYDRSRPRTADTGASSGKAKTDSQNRGPSGSSSSREGGPRSNAGSASSSSGQAAASPSQGESSRKLVGAGGKRLVPVAVTVAIVGFLKLAASGSHSSPIATPPTSLAPSSSAPALVANAAPDVPVGQMVSWDAKRDGTPKTYIVGGYELTLSSRPDANAPLPVLQIKAPDGSTFTQTGQPGLDTASATVGVGHFDSGTPGNQIIFTTYSGGAHCCTDVTILEQIGGTWKAIDVAGFQGDTWTDFPKDVDGDGIADIVGPDGRFAYAFTDFADSLMPPRIYNVARGGAIDVSSSMRFAKVYRADMKIARAGCAEHNNGACAAFVADASRLGLHDWAWREMLANYDANHSWDYPTRCLVAVSGGVCPPTAQQKYADFPGALEAFLQESGYTAAPPTPAPAVANPAFDCGQVQSAVLTLVCNTSDLAAADRDLSVAYKAALAQSSDPKQLEAEERAWIIKRNNMPADPDVLRRMYALRLAQLRQPTGGN